MFLRTMGGVALALVLPMLAPMASAFAESKGKVLVVMSSAHQLDLKDGKTYATGYYLNEFEVPYRKLVEAGYQPVIADPNGDQPVMDANSNNKLFFGGDDADRAAALTYVEGIAQLKHPKTLASVVADGTRGYVGIFIPGGHAPMVDLLTDKNLGKILISFHHSGRPTAIICHGPVALLSTLPDAPAFVASMIANDGKANALAQGWPYAGYRMTVFSTGEEQVLEGPGPLYIGGNVQFYPVNALAEAGARVISVANWHSNVVIDHELITGQQPMSASALGDVLVTRLNRHTH
ncbi:type 1 glutamine amidotransferase domain-containing protein [Acidisoma cellulosilytica]|uniref:Type 1 glutamine amidotransferase domain-containing protein n=1 Tax=Acidisoma cellulosilyticum TaxID=2802395 RepID=A0A963YXN5_9PROT|nr:type 1 glutamine amidotransferase domain-containing protein [Acidisoma cellulosilyticum]MCB8878845.1 type 1 glutamine amidotransferase domain-containing protein [Acidisoma cellulosilyticum]